MNVTLKMKDSPGRVLFIAEGKRLVIGRASTADFSFPEQQFLSSRHCEVQATREGARVADLGSSNGTFVNGNRVRESVLSDGDELSVGHITFLVQLSPSLPAGAAAQPKQADAQGPSPASAGSVDPSLQMGSWSLRGLPAGWEIIEGYGIRDANQGAFPSTVICSQEMLSSEVTLDQYIKNQLVVIRANMPQARPKEMVPAAFPQASEAARLEIELPAPHGRGGILQQFYARFGSRVGIVTFATLASELPRLQPLFESIRSGLSFRTE
ncbi:MAG TPA: FHA domain-containing protein [Candidatus Bathyarchaeia archaeon]|nr:FHA domain-containing protein [Candidatus Bathyarchaeia archaeon]